MKIDSALRLFSEKYDREAIQSIDTISKDYGLNISGSTIKAFNIKESFDTFSEYLVGYGKYKAENVNNPEASTQEAIKENVSKFVNEHVFKEAEIKYADLPAFVKGYIEGVNSLLETVETVKSTMMDAEVAQEAVGDVNTFVDQFMDKLQESFDPAMDTILWASGYNARQRMISNDKVQSRPTFL